MALSSEATQRPGQALEMTRTFDAPRTLVWRMWSDPVHMMRWHGPEGFWLTACEMDFRVGGKWRRCMSRAADHEHWIYGTYLEIDEPRRLSFSYINGYDPDWETVVTLDFEERDGRTVMHFRQAPFLKDEELASHGFGWESSLNLLAQYLVRAVANDGKPVGKPRRDGVAEDIIAARQRQKETADADAAKNR